MPKYSISTTLSPNTDPSTDSLFTTSTLSLLNELCITFLLLSKTIYKQLLGLTTYTFMYMKQIFKELNKTFEGIPGEFVEQKYGIQSVPSYPSYYVSPFGSLLPPLYSLLIRVYSVCPTSHPISPIISSLCGSSSPLYSDLYSLPFSILLFYIYIYSYLYIYTYILICISISIS